MCLSTLKLKLLKAYRDASVPRHKANVKMEGMIIMLMMLFGAMVFFVMGAKVIDVINNISL